MVHEAVSCVDTLKGIYFITVVIDTSLMHRGTREASSTPATTKKDPAVCTEVSLQASKECRAK